MNDFKDFPDAISKNRVRTILKYKEEEQEYIVEKYNSIIKTLSELINNSLENYIPTYEIKNFGKMEIDKDINKLILKFLKNKKFKVDIFYSIDDIDENGSKIECDDEFLRVDTNYNISWD
jgi:hypothetical protein